MRGQLIKNSSSGMGLATNQSLIKITLTSFDNSSVISGMAFSVKNTSTQAVITVNTDDNGKCEALVTPGTYQVSCTPSSTYETPAVQTIVAYPGKEVSTAFHLYSNVNSFVVNLTSFDNAGISGCTLTISGTVSRTYTFPASGNLTFTLPNGSYTLAVSGNSTRYVTPANKSYTVARGAATTTANFNLATNVGTINTKVTSYNGSGIAGVVLTITNSNGTAVATTTLTSAGTHTVDLNPGTYTLALSGIPNGYEPPANQSVTVARGGSYSVNFNMAQRLTVIYGVRITKSNSSPTHVTYTDDAAGLSPSTMSSSGVCTDNGWTARLKELFGIRPCVFQNGAVNYYLSESNFNYKEDGATASNLTGTDGDVMIEFSKMGYMSITSDSTYVYIKVANSKVDSTYTDWPFSYKGTVRDKFYIGAYLGYVTGSNLYSRSGVSPTVSQAITAFITNAHNRGTGYEIVPMNKLILLQVLYFIRFRHMNSQAAVGLGYTGASAKTNTGATNAQGMNYGTTGNTVHVKVNGIEDFWGNVYWFIDGLFCDSSGNIRVGDKDIVSASNGTGYTTKATISANINGYISDIQATNELGFLIKGTSGSDSTYYCDYGSCCLGYVGCFGGGWNYGLAAGFSRLCVNYSLSDSYSYIGARLAWCGA